VLSPIKVQGSPIVDETPLECEFGGAPHCQLCTEQRPRYLDMLNNKNGW
jgi:hypothetical protein